MRAALLAMLLLPSAAALTQEPLTFKGVAIGADRAAVVAAFPSLSSGTPPCEAGWCYLNPSRSCSYVDPEASQCFKELSYGGILPQLISFTFRDGRLINVLVVVKAEQFDDLVKPMQMRFGKPSALDATPVQNRMGATFDQLVMRWHRDGVFMSARKRNSDNLTESTISFHSEAEVRRSTRERDEAQKKAAKGL